MFTDWCKEQDIEPRFIQPGKPDQNAHIERFLNRIYCEDVLLRSPARQSVAWLSRQVGWQSYTES
jgi:transposase InsO family protein